MFLEFWETWLDFYFCFIFALLFQNFEALDALLEGRWDEVTKSLEQCGKSGALIKSNQDVLADAQLDNLRRTAHPAQVFFFNSK